MHFRKFDIDLKIFLKENTNDTEKEHIQDDLEKPGKESAPAELWSYFKIQKEGERGQWRKKVFQAISCFLTWSSECLFI